ncbi:STAS domain-containing protein [Desulfonema magnum]|uniref:Anti-sigma factor antagonist n=1 Tax=Desulfonema magnum TaxID=45655 RepID=A0A975GRJ4_9BACT|nr:STAS domain-containing protein [Desulfonema magnum]QTA91079.1 Anti-sigma-B factor antagonist [Desulfonema magnum]
MNITENVQGNVHQVYLEGRFDADTADKVEEFIRKKIKKKISHFVLDMENVSFIASAGLRVVIVLAKELRGEHKGDLYVAALQPSVYRVFEISGLNNVLSIFDDTETATQSFN